jgi:hypothetical protein
MIDQVEKEKGKAIPIAVLLCPLKVIIWKSGEVLDVVENQDVDSDLIDRCGRIWDELGRVNAKLNAIRTSSKQTSRPFLRQFEETLSRYKDLVKKSLKNV